MPLPDLARLLQAETDLLSVLLTRVERAAAPPPASRHDVLALRDELATLDLARAVALTEAGLAPDATAGAVARLSEELRQLVDDLRAVATEVEAATAPSGLPWLLPRSLVDFLQG